MGIDPCPFPSTRPVPRLSVVRIRKVAERRLGQDNQARGGQAPGGFGGTSLAAGTGRSFRGKDAGSPRIDFRYGGDRGHSLGASGAPPAAQMMFRQALLQGPYCFLVEPLRHREEAVGLLVDPELLVGTASPR